MTAILRQVDKTFTFEEQRVEINEIGLDLYNLRLSEQEDIELLDFTVATATQASGGGSLSYVIEGTAPNQVGKFTFTPADVFSGDFDDLSNKPTNLSDFTDDLNYSIPSDLSDLDDVLITNETSNHYLKWNGTKWVNEVLNEIVVNTNLSSTLPQLTRTITATGVTLNYTPPDLSAFAVKVVTSDSSPFGPYDGQLWWKSDEGKLKIAYQDTDSLQWVDASPAGIQLSDLTVNEKTAAATSKLEYDSATGIFDYTPTTAGSNTNSSLVVTADVPPTSPSDGELWYNSAQGKLKIYYEDVDSSQWVDTNGGGGSQAVSYSDFTGATSSTDGTAGLVIKPSAGDEGKYLKGDGTWATVTSGTTYGVVTDQADGLAPQLPTVSPTTKYLRGDGTWVTVTSGSSGIALTDLEVVSPNPTASGSGGLAYDNTNGEFTYTPPVIPAAQVQSDWDATAPSGGLGVILNKPYVPPFVEIADPANNIDSGKVLKWNGTHWAPGTDVSGGSGTSSAQEHDMFWLSRQSIVAVGAPGADRIGYGGGVNDVIGQGDAKLGDFGRVTEVGFAKSGNGMTELNGVFAFPTTGQWRVKSTVHCYGRETGAQAGKFANGISYSSDYTEPTNSTYNTYVECLGEPKCSEQISANGYTEDISYETGTTSTSAGNAIANIFDGDNATFVDMGIGHADISYLWLTHAMLTDVVKITIGYDGHGWIGFGGVNFDSAAMPRVDNGQAYGANGVTGSPTEIVVYDGTSNNTPALSSTLQALSFVEYPDVNGQGGNNKGPGSRCHVYYIKIQRSTDNVLTEITYNAAATTPTWTKVNRQWSIMDSQIYPHFNEVSVEYVFNITDTSTQKVRFELDNSSHAMHLDNNGLKQSRFFFQKLEGIQGLPGQDGDDGEDGADGAADFLTLTDTPNDFTGQDGKFLKVKSTEDGLEFTDAPTGGGGGANVSTDDTPPSTPTDGDLWWDSHNGRLNVYYEDVNSSQWVDATSNGGVGALPATINDQYGNVRSLPVNTQAAAYTIQTSDTGKMVKASGDVTTSSANEMSEGDVVTIYNATAGDINITRSSTNMYLVGDSSSSDRVLATKGVATLICVGSNEYVLMGGGIT